MTDDGTAHQLDRESKGTRYYRNAVERHWDPFEIALDADREHLRAYLRESAVADEAFGVIRQNIARFGAGEEAVTEDLAPLATALDDLDDQMFITTQQYEEAKHTDFFDRYWREVINPVEVDLGYGRSAPTESRWFNDAYEELFERNERAMHRLLEDRSPRTFARAYAHYHLVVEGILAQTGYYGMQRSFSAEEFPELPHLPGLHTGFTRIRQDEGRHIGFGMAKLKELLTEGVDPQLLDDTVIELMPLVNGVAADESGRGLDRGVTPTELRRYAAEKHRERMSQIRDADTAETLTTPDED